MMGGIKIVEVQVERPGGRVENGEPMVGEHPL